MNEYFVYMLRCRDGSFYTGVTNDYRLRISQHALGEDPTTYTFKRRPVKLVYLAEFCDINDAIAWEKRLKRWSRRKKEALIRENWDEIQKKSRCCNGTNHSYFSPIICHAKRSRSMIFGVLSLTSLDYARDDK